MEVPPPAPRSFLCRALSPFPRVFAAEAVAADPKALVKDQKLPSYVPEPPNPESGWDRLRELFVKDTPIGGLLMALQKYCGETVQERKQKDRKALQELKLEERKARLHFTELLPEEIESNLQKNQSKADAKKIEALLNLPRNPSSADKQDKD
uniref:Complex I assembly factor TIMMDC1, mitochondrial n=1 Tax=Monodon monoceros TaxID=40151 RepID=A0A8C6F7D6_MONMO